MDRKIHISSLMVNWFRNFVFIATNETNFGLLLMSNGFKDFIAHLIQVSSTYTEIWLNHYLKFSARFIYFDLKLINSSLTMPGLSIIFKYLRKGFGNYISTLEKIELECSPNKKTIWIIILNTFIILRFLLTLLEVLSTYKWLLVFTK